MVQKCSGRISTFFSERFRSAWINRKNNSKTGMEMRHGDYIDERKKGWVRFFISFLFSDLFRFYLFVTGGNKPFFLAWASGYCVCRRSWASDYFVNLVAFHVVWCQAPQPRAEEPTVKSLSPFLLWFFWSPQKIFRFVNCILRQNYNR